MRSGKLLPGPGRRLLPRHMVPTVTSTGPQGAGLDTYSANSLPNVKSTMLGTLYTSGYLFLPLSPDVQNVEKSFNRKLRSPSTLSQDLSVLKSEIVKAQRF